MPPQNEFDIYFTGKNTLGGNVIASPLYGNEQVKGIIFNFSTLNDAFFLAISKEYLVPALQEVMPHGYLEAASALAREFAIQFTYVAGAAALGALIGGTAGTPIPLAGTVAGAGAGAALGASIAGWFLFGIGVIQAAQAAGYISGIASTNIEAGFQAAMRGDKETAAKELAKFFAIILSVLVPILVVAVLFRGAHWALGKFAPKFAQSKALNNWIAKLPLEIKNLKEASQVLGMTQEEIRAVSILSKGKILVIRGCNPARLQYINAGYHAKPFYVSWHTSKSGKYVGQVILSNDEAAALHFRHFDMTPVPGKLGLFRLDHKIGARFDTPDAKKLGNLEGHYLERVTENGVTQYRLLHRDGKPFVGDLDRVLYAEFGPTGELRPSVYGKNPHWLNDDTREFQFMNEELNKKLAHPVSSNVFQHGYAWNYKKQDNSGRLIPGWPNYDPRYGTWNFTDEPLLVAVNGNVYIMNWTSFAGFCKAFKQVGLMFPWN